MMVDITETVSSELLNEILAGLDGVTPGPWENIDGTGIIRSEHHDGRHDVARSDLMWGLNRSGSNAAHIARCDPDTMRSILTELQQLRAASATPQAETAPDVAGQVKVPEGQTPLNDKLHHRLLDVINEGIKARDEGGSSPYHGHSLEHCLHATGWVQRDLRLALDDLEELIAAQHGDVVVRTAKLLYEKDDKIALLTAALERQRANIERWIETGEPASPDESKSIYEQICAALEAQDGK